MQLDKKGQCCGRKPWFKPIIFKGYSCTLCKREYDMNGMQRENSTWKKNAVGRYCRRNSEDRRGYIILRGYEDRRRMLMEKGQFTLFQNIRRGRLKQ